MKKAVIIGSGIAGIASAIRLQNKGYSVQILEKNNYPGGKITQLTGNGFGLMQDLPFLQCLI